MQARAWQVSTLVCLAVGCTSCGSTSTPQPAAPASTTDPADASPQSGLTPLMQSLARSEDPEAWSTEHAAELTPEITAQARALGQSQEKSGPADHASLQTALLAFSIAGYGAAHNGQAAASLEDHYNAAQSLFMLSDDAHAYQAIRFRALDLMQKAVSLHELPLAFHTATLAANCAYFEHGETASQEVSLSDGIMADWVTAAELAISSKHPVEDVRFEEFADLGGAIAGNALNAYAVAKLGGKPANVAPIEKFTAMTERTIPVRFAFKYMAQPADKTQSLAAVLGKLSSEYGDAKVARARVAFRDSVPQPNTDGAQMFGQLSKIGAEFEVETTLHAPPSTFDALEKKARGLVTSLRSGMRSPTGRIWVSHELDEIYGPLLAKRLASGPASPQLLFAAAEATKARTLLDRIKQHAVALPVGSEARAAELEHQALGFAKADDAEASRFLQEMRLISQLESSDQGESWSEQGRASQRWNAVHKLEQLYATTSAGLSGVTEPTSATEVVKSLQPREAILEYFVPYNPLAPATELWAIAVTKSGIRSKRLDISVLHHDESVNVPCSEPSAIWGDIRSDGQAPLASSPLGDFVVHVRTAIRESHDEEVKPCLALAYRLLLAPAKELGIDPSQLAHLIIVPHGALHYLPFPALISGNGSFLAEQVATTIAPSASVLTALRGSRPSPAKFLALAPALPESAHTAQLAGAVDECSAAAAKLKLPSQILSGADADFSGLSREASDAGILHLSTHGQFPDDDAANSHFMWLAPSGSFDGRLTAQRVRDLDLHKAKLVALSVCNGAVYRDGPGDEPYGLVPAFLEAGARNVLGASWPIEDAFAPRFMATFYGELAHRSPAAAYQATMKALIKKDEFIRRWAGFVLVGPG